jgi:hypothetical protein
MASRSFILSNIVALLCTDAITAFAGPNRHIALTTSSLLQVAKPGREEISWLELPTPRKQRNSFLDNNLPSVETVVGRVAMIGAIGLLVTEITTGESFMEQVMLAVKGM